MIDVFSFRFYWHGRKESFHDLSKRIHGLFESLNESYPFWANWNLPSRGRTESLRIVFENRIEVIETQLLIGTKNKDIDQDGFSELGFSFGLYKEDHNKNPYGLSVFGGYDGSLFPNNCLIEFRNPNNFSKLEIIGLVKVLIKHLEPNYGCVVSNNFEELIDDSANRVGWITLSEKIIEGKLLPNSIVCEIFENNYLYYLKDEHRLFDYKLIEDFRKLKDLVILR